MSAEPVFTYRAGTIPLLISMPHAGTRLSPDLAGALTDAAAALPDTDWHLPLLYDFAAATGAHLLVAGFSRFVVDLNRPEDDRPLYPGATTGLFPDLLFDGRPVYRAGAVPDGAARAARVTAYWRPYHDRIATTLAELRASHGRAVLFDAHSIRSVVPRLFAGKLPDFNLGTNDGTSAAPDLAASLVAICAAADGFTHVLNGRFKGGYITRQYGHPADGVHAVQLELCQSTYMDEHAPFAYRPDRAARVRPVLARIVERLAHFAMRR